MLLALLIYLAANQGILIAAPIVINSLAIGAIATESAPYTLEKGTGK